MEEVEIVELVLSVLKDAQKTSGRAWTDLGPKSTPIGVLDGFDSLSGLEATMLIEQRLLEKTSVELPKVDSFFVTDDKALTLDETCKKIAAALSGVA